MTRRARALRTGATDAERRLWALLRSYRPRFTRQLVIGPYIVDFACRSARLAIEIDGGQHATAKERDQVRTAFLGRQGWRVLRFWNSDVAGNPSGVAEAILAAAAECLGGTHPQALPSREGRGRHGDRVP